MADKDEKIKKKVKYFEFPLKKMILSAAGKTGLDLLKESITHPKATANIIRNTFFGEKEKICFAIVYGETNQSRFSGPYSGSQCTSMSVAAIAWWILGGNTGTFTPENINLTLRMGHRLHQTLRSDYNLSSNSDLRVSIDDLPKYLMIGLLGQVAVISRTDDDSFVMTSLNQNAEELDTLETYLETWQERRRTKPEGFLLTIGDYSNAIMYNNEGIWLWFDSHGYMRVNSTRCKKYASVVELADIVELTKFIIALRGPSKVCQIVPISCRSEGKPENHVLFGAANLPEITQRQIENLPVAAMSEEDLTPEPSNSVLGVEIKKGTTVGAVGGATAYDLSDIYESTDDEDEYESISSASSITSASANLYAVDLSTASSTTVSSASYVTKYAFDTHVTATADATALAISTHEIQFADDDDDEESSPFVAFMGGFGEE